MLTSLASSIVVMLVRKFRLDWIEKKEVEQLLRDAFNAGRATGLAEAAKKREGEILAEPPPPTPQAVQTILNDIFGERK
jgi:hypothetical protein